MKVTRTGGVTKCVLNATEQAENDRVIARCDQLAYHYRDTDLGDSMADVVNSLTAVQADTEICPPAKGKDNNADTD